MNKTLLEHFKDFADGVYDTFITAPIALGDFIARGTGIRDWQMGTGDYYMKQAKFEVDAISAIMTHPRLFKEVVNQLKKEVANKPMYFVSGAIAGMGSSVLLNKLGKLPIGSITSSEIFFAKIDAEIQDILKNNQELYDAFQESGLLDLINEYLKQTASLLGTLSYFFNPFDDNWKDQTEIRDYWLNQAKHLFGYYTYDPIVLDLNGDGIKIIPEKDGVYFDHNGDRVLFHSSWIDKNDGLLIVDKNCDNDIDSGDELFGNFTKISSKFIENKAQFAINGFEALKEFDSTNDGVISNLDTKFGELKIWQDKNSNGISEKDELKSLDQLGIVSLSLKHTKTDENLGDNNILFLKSTFTTKDNQTHTMGDVDFNVNGINSKFKDEIKLSDEYKNLINLKGSGFLRDLNQAAVLNNDLKEILISYEKAKTKDEQLKILPNLVKAWSDTNINGDYDIFLKTIKLPNTIRFKNKSGGGYNYIVVNANGQKVDLEVSPKDLNIKGLTPSQIQILKRGLLDKTLLDKFENIKWKIKIIDSFFGNKSTELYYIGDDDLKSMINTANKNYDDILKRIYNSLLPQTRLKEYINLVELKIEDNFSLSYDNSAVVKAFLSLSKTNPQKAFVDLCEFVEIYGKDKALVSPLISLLSKLSQTAKENGVLNEYLSLLNKETIKISPFNTAQKMMTFLSAQVS